MHLRRGVHTLEKEKETLIDYVMMSSSLALDSYRSARNQILLSAVQADQEGGVPADTERVELGWALRETTKRNPEDQPARDYVAAYFRNRRSTGLKADPKTVHSLMQSSKKADGSSTFAPRNQLSLKQVKSLIRSLLQKEKKEKVDLEIHESDVESSDDELFLKNLIEVNSDRLFAEDCDDDTLEPPQRNRMV